ncbi:MAG: hydroxyacid dehydrogenase, partial [Flavobacteriaceae bacterium]
MKSVLHIDSNHEVLARGLSQLGYENTFDYTSSSEEILQQWPGYTGLVVRSRFSINRSFIDRATGLKWIGRVGAGLENIDVAYAQSKGVAVIAAPEGNRGAVAEHALGMLLSMTNKLCA